MHKREMYPDIDHMDVTARQESLAVRGEPILLQLPLNPCYALTIHKAQALSIKRAFVHVIVSLACRCHFVRMSWRGTPSAAA